MSNTKIIPIFPLDLVLFPNQDLPLRIFEPRYKQMVDDCMVEEKPSEIIQKVKYWYLKKYKKNIKARGGSEFKRIEGLERSKETT